MPLEHKLKISQAQKGRISVHRRGITALNSLENKKYDCVYHAAEGINGTRSNIRKAIKSGKLYKGYYWKYTVENPQAASLGSVTEPVEQNQANPIKSDQIPAKFTNYNLLPHNDL